MKTMMMNNDQTAASSVIWAKADGLCELVMPHLVDNMREKEGRRQYVNFLSQFAHGLVCYRPSLNI